MENNLFKGQGFGISLPNQNFQRREGYSYGSNQGIQSPKQEFTSLDGRKFDTKDKMFAANQEFYKRNLNEAMKKNR